MYASLQTSVNSSYTLAPRDLNPGATVGALHQMGRPLHRVSVHPSLSAIVRMSDRPTGENAEKDSLMNSPHPLPPPTLVSLIAFFNKCLYIPHIHHF